MGKTRSAEEISKDIEELSKAINLLVNLYIKYIEGAPSDPRNIESYYIIFNHLEALRQNDQQELAGATSNHSELNSN